MKHLIGLFLIVVTSILANANPAQADILFIDLNASSSEVQAAKAAAEKRGEKLLVFPEIPSELQGKIRGFKREIHRFEEKRALLRAMRQKAKKGPEWDRLHAEISAIDEKVRPLRKALARFLEENKIEFDLSKVRGLLERYQNEQRSISSVIISGHQAFEGYFGEVGQLETPELAKLFGKFPELARQVSSAYLWGCYSATKDQLRLWKDIFPNLYVVGGFDGSAPTEERSFDTEYLTTLLVQEKKISEQTDAKKLLKYYRSIKDVQFTRAVLCVGELYANREGVSDVNAQCDPKEIETLKRAIEDYQKYLHADVSGYEDVPPNTQASIVRTAYSLLRKLSHCPELKDHVSERDRMTRLIFFKTVAQNFQRIFEDEIQQANQILHELGAERSIRFPEFGDPGVKRAEILERMRAISKFLSTTEGSDVPYVLAVHQKAKTILQDLECVGPAWIEPETKRDDLIASYRQSCANSP